MSALDELIEGEMEEPCKNCGSVNLGSYYCGLEDGYPFHGITCKDCGVYLIYPDEDELISLWNKGHYYQPKERRYYIKEK